MADFGTFSSIVDTVVNGTNSSQTLRAYSSQPTFRPGTDWRDFGFRGLGGNDLIIAAHGDDEIFGGSGNDTVRSYYGFNDVDGGTGEDTLDYSWFGDFTTLNITSGVSVSLSAGTAVARNSGVRFGDSIESVENVIGSDFNDRIVGNTLANDIAGGIGSDYLSGGSGADVLEGQSSSDSLYGGSGGDDLFGGSGNDYLSGGSGIDSLFGSTGDDDLFGGLGGDDLVGGSGFDYFIFTSVNDSNVFLGVDLIKDFVEDVDQMDFRGIDANENIVGKQAFTFIGTREFTGLNRGELRYDSLSSATVVEADVNADGLADFTLDVAGIHDFVRRDFILLQSDLLA
jgi:Ca2+-binding RTX toxin-like protein